MHSDWQLDKQKEQSFFMKCQSRELKRHLSIKYERPITATLILLFWVRLNVWYSFSELYIIL